MTPRLLLSHAASHTASHAAAGAATRRAVPRSAHIVVLLVGFAVAAGCDRPPSADSLKEWTQADHHSSDDDKAAAAAGAQVARAAPGATPASDVAQLVDLTWRQQCMTCHGTMGRGDGQMGPMVQAPDLTRAEWQSRVTDVEMAATIKAGRNRMPSFNLPDAVLSGLVVRIRSLQGR